MDTLAMLVRLLFKGDTLRGVAMGDYEGCENTENYAARVPRGMRTPITEAGEVISQACDLYVKWFGEHLKRAGRDPEKEFFEIYFSDSFNSPDTNGDAAMDEFFKDFDNDPGEATKFTLLRTLCIACSYAVQAMKATKTNNQMAWSFAADASHWIGVTKAASSMKDGAIDFSLLGKSGAKLRHAPMRALKEWTIARYQEGSFSSANQAAHALKDEVMEHGKKIDAHLSAENAQRTIAEWIRKSV